MIKFAKQKLFKDTIIRAIYAFAQNNGCIAEHLFYPCRIRSDQLFSFFK